MRRRRYRSARMRRVIGRRRTANRRFWGRASRPILFGTTKKTEHRYVEPRIVLTQGVANRPEIYLFRANGMFDPNFTGTGHQPSGFDTMTPLYDHYTVIGSKLRVSFSRTGTSTDPIICGVMLSDTNSPTVTDGMQGFIESGRGCKWAQLTAYDARGILTLTINCVPHKFLGRSHPLSDPQLKGNAASDPSEEVFFVVWIMAQDGTTTASTIQASVQIDYGAVWTEPRQLPLS